MKFPIVFLALVAVCSAYAQASHGAERRMVFQPIAGSAYGREGDADIDTLPFLIPVGYQQRVVSSERDLNLYAGSDMLDMNTVNESGRQAGRYLYRTHEVRPGAVGNDRNSRRRDGGSGGAVSVVDLQTGAARELVGRPDWEALDGIVWTPWHTLLVTEEAHTTVRPDPAVPLATSGLVYEIRLAPGNPMAAASVAVRPLLGALAHEGIEVDATGDVYVIDETPSGSIYRFVPYRYGDLSRGQLYALKVSGQAKTGRADWVALDMSQVQVSAREAAMAVGATPYCRPEDIERIDQTLYVALTCEDVDDAANTRGPGAILAIDLDGPPAVRYVVAPGRNVPFETRPGLFSAGVTGFRYPDNLARGPDGTLWIAEDNAWSDIWVYDPRSKDANGDGYRDGVTLFASLKDRAGEASGIYFGPDPGTLFVNLQHSGTGNDKTVAISRRRPGQ
jgi:hypothetical protein